jgi:hypothetical protein
MTVRPFMLRGFAVVAWAVIAASMPVLAEASWIRPSCGHAPCPDGLYGISLTISKGWETHPSKNPQVMILVPNRHCFYCQSSGPFIELMVEFNSENRSIAEFTEEQQARWRANIPRGRSVVCRMSIESTGGNRSRPIRSRIHAGDGSSAWRSRASSTSEETRCWSA